MDQLNSTQLIDQKVEDRFFKALLSHDRLIHLVNKRMKEEYFSTQVKAKLFSTICKFVGEYGSLPTIDNLVVELEGKWDSHSAKLVQRLLLKLEQLPVPEWGWVVGRVDRWIKTIEFRKALYEASLLIDDKQLVAAQDKVLRVIRTGNIEESKTFDVLRTTADGIADYVMEEDLFCSPTRVYALDSVIKGLYRQELCIIMAPLNVGKTWALVHLAVAALISGLPVLYISLEMGRVKVIQRIFQNIAGVVAPDSSTEVSREVELWTDAFQGKEPLEVRSLLDVGKVSKHVGYLKNFGGILSVEAYPSGTMTTGDIERQVLTFDAVFNRPPGLLLVDGLTDISLTGGRRGASDWRRVGLTEATRELRRIGIQNNMAVVATHQSNRPGMVAEIVEAVHTGEALAILQIADLGISLNQTRAEHALEKMRLFVMRARGKKKWVMIEMFQSLGIGQFCLASRVMGPDEWSGSAEESESSKDHQLDRGRAQRRFSG